MEFASARLLSSRRGRNVAPATSTWALYRRCTAKSFTKPETAHILLPKIVSVAARSGP